MQEAKKKLTEDLFCFTNNNIFKKVYQLLLYFFFVSKCVESSQKFSKTIFEFFTISDTVFCRFANFNEHMVLTSCRKPKKLKKDLFISQMILVSKKFISFCYIFCLFRNALKVARNLVKQYLNFYNF